MTSTKPVLALVALTLATAAAQQTPPAEQIIGWHRVCAVELPLKYGTMKAKRWVSDNGKMLHGSDDVVWTGTEPARSGISPAYWYQVTWSRFPAASAVTVRDLDGRVAIEVGLAGRKMPRAALFALRRPIPPETASSTAALGTPLFSPRTRYFDFAYFRLDEVLAYGTGLDAIDFAMETLPGERKPETWSKGTLDLAPLREAAGALAEIDSLLTAKAARFATECTREPEYDNPGPDIV